MEKTVEELSLEVIGLQASLQLLLQLLSKKPTDAVEMESDRLNELFSALAKAQGEMGKDLFECEEV